ncbi:MAG: hypothetical protein DRJ49_02140 [Thermoprotei archaeon]|nr:MAG: hypothetical protein DRJ49_02140 [Thermoprotei archaeon]
MKFKLAVIGCGGVGIRHIEGIAQLYRAGFEDIEIAAVCDLDRVKAEQAIAKIAVLQGTTPRVYTDYKRMIKEVDLDAVDICLPHHLHHTVAIDCLEEGLNVLIEKPLAITMRAARRIMETAEKYNKVLAVAENYRRRIEDRAVKVAVDKGLIGEPRLVIWTITHWNPYHAGWREDKFKAGGSWILDGGVHMADLDRYHLGKEPIEVYGKVTLYEPIKSGLKVTVDDTSLALIVYEGNAYSHWFWSRATPAYTIETRMIYGSKGAIAIEGPPWAYRLKSIRIQHKDYVEELSGRYIGDRLRSLMDKELEERWFPYGVTYSFATEIYDFYYACTHGVKPEVDGWEAYRDMAVIFAIYESSVLGEPVKIEDIEKLKIEEYQSEINEKLGIE